MAARGTRRGWNISRMPAAGVHKCVPKPTNLFRFRPFRTPAGSQRRLPPSDEGGAPKGRRERKTGSFCRKIFGFSGFSDLVRQSRSRAKPSETRPISPSAAPPQLPRQEELRPGRARNAPGLEHFAGACCRDGHGPAERVWYIQHTTSFPNPNSCKKGGRSCEAAPSAFWVIQRAESGRCPGPFRRRI